MPWRGDKTHKLDEKSNTIANHEILLSTCFPTFLLKPQSFFKIKIMVIRTPNKLHTSTELFYFYFFILCQLTYTMFSYDVTSGKNTECKITIYHTSVSIAY